MTTPAEVLAQVPLFSMLSKKQLAELASEAHDRTFPPGTVITGEDRAGTSFGVIVTGTAASTAGPRAPWAPATTSARWR